MPSRTGTSAVTLAKRLVQFRSMDCYTAADTVPDSLEVDVGEGPAPVVEEALTADKVRTGRDRSDAELRPVPVPRFRVGIVRRRSAATRLPARRLQR